jgi:hypothetical protein
MAAALPSIIQARLFAGGVVAVAGAIVVYVGTAKKAGPSIGLVPKGFAVGYRLGF